MARAADARWDALAVCRVVVGVCRAGGAPRGQVVGLSAGCAILAAGLTLLVLKFAAGAGLADVADCVCRVAEFALRTRGAHRLGCICVAARGTVLATLFAYCGRRGTELAGSAGGARRLCYIRVAAHRTVLAALFAHCGGGGAKLAGGAGGARRLGCIGIAAGGTVLAALFAHCGGGGAKLPVGACSAAEGATVGICVAAGAAIFAGRRLVRPFVLVGAFRRRQVRMDDDVRW